MYSLHATLYASVAHKGTAKQPMKPRRSRINIMSTVLSARYLRRNTIAQNYIRNEPYLVKLNRFMPNVRLMCRLSYGVQCINTTDGRKSVEPHETRSFKTDPEHEYSPKFFLWIGLARNSPIGSLTADILQTTGNDQHVQTERSLSSWPRLMFA